MRAAKFAVAAVVLLACLWGESGLQLFSENVKRSSCSEMANGTADDLYDFNENGFSQYCKNEVANTKSDLMGNTFEQRKVLVSTTNIRINKLCDISSVKDLDQTELVKKYNKNVRADKQINFD